jgi:hypothetical protein
MADIVYVIEYIEVNGVEKFTLTPDIRKIGTQPDSIGFMTTQATVDHLAKEQKKIAVVRDKDAAGKRKDPFPEGPEGMPERLFLQVAIGAVDFFVVKKPGLEKKAFHLTCGEVDDATGQFEPFEHEASVPMP